MKIAWHCLGCDQKGTFDKPIQDIIDPKDGQINLIDRLILFVKRTYHGTCKGAIGVKTADD
jgi:hypothetical protein